MFERFTDRARRAVVLGQEEARTLRHNYIGTEHLLLGLIAEGEGVAAKALQDLGVELAAIRRQILERVGPGPQEPENHIPFTPRAKEVMSLSLREALMLGHNYIGTEHLLLGLVREESGLAAQVLTDNGITHTDVRTRVVELLSGIAATAASRVPRPGGAGEAPEDRDLTPALRGALTRARRIARDRELVGTHHLLAALVLLGDSAAAQILDAGGFDIDELPTEIVAWDVTGTGDEDPVRRATRGTVVIQDETGMSVRLDDDALVQRLTDALAAGTITDDVLRQALGKAWVEVLGDLLPPGDDDSGDASGGDA